MFGILREVVSIFGAAIARDLAELPEGIEKIVIPRKGDYPASVWYVNVARPQKIDVGIAQDRFNGWDIIRDHIGFVGQTGKVYFAKADLDEEGLPEGIGVPDDNGFIYVMSETGLEMARRGKSVGAPRQHMLIHKDALSDA